MAARRRHVLQAGDRYGAAAIEVPDITLVSESGERRHGCLMRCDCGALFAAQVGNVIRGRQPTCGSCDLDLIIARRAVSALLAGRGLQLVRLEVRRRDG